MGDPPCFDSSYYKSSLYILYGGMRKTLFIDEHPLDGVSADGLGLKVGKAFYDLNEKVMEYKDSGWRVKAKFGEPGLFNLKMKIGEKRKGDTRPNIQFGSDDSHFGSDNKINKYSFGGMFTFGMGGLIATTRLKIFNDKAAEVFASASVGDAQLGCDLRITEDEPFQGFVGASYGLPSMLGLSNLHFGTIVAVSQNGLGAKSVGLFAEVPVPSVKKATVGMEIFDQGGGRIGAEVALDGENSIIAKSDSRGLANISFIKQFKGIDVQMGCEADLTKGSFGRLGALVSLKQ